MAQVINRKVEASTLVEVLIAMVVILVVFAVALGVFKNVLSSGISLRKLQAQAQMEVLVKTSRENGLLALKTITIDSINYDLETKSSEMQGMLMLEVRASERGRPLGNIRCLINTDDEKATN